MRWNYEGTEKVKATFILKVKDRDTRLSLLLFIIAILRQFMERKIINCKPFSFLSKKGKLFQCLWNYSFIY